MLASVYQHRSTNHWLTDWLTDHIYKYIQALPPHTLGGVMALAFLTTPGWSCPRLPGVFTCHSGVAAPKQCRNHGVSTLGISWCINTDHIGILVWCSMCPLANMTCLRSNMAFYGFFGIASNHVIWVCLLVTPWFVWISDKPVRISQVLLVVPQVGMEY